MKPVIIIALVIVWSVVTVLAIIDVSWHYANQEYQKVQEEHKRDLIEIEQNRIEVEQRQKEKRGLIHLICQSKNVNDTEGYNYCVKIDEYQNILILQELRDEWNAIKEKE